MIRRCVCCWLVTIATWVCFFSGKPGNGSFTSFKTTFLQEYESLNIPGIEYDYRDYFKTIPSLEEIEKQSSFFKDRKLVIEHIQRSKLTKTEQQEYDHILYEIDFNLYRLSLEQQWVNAGRATPENGLHGLANNSEWYTYFIKKFTSVNITPEQVYALGKQEVARVQKEIDAIRVALGFRDSAAFYRHLQNDSFYIQNKAVVIGEFERIDNIVRGQLQEFIDGTVPPVYAMEWPDAGQFTPPGMYLNHSHNAYGKDVFQFNFWNGRHNRRAMEWLYMHEAIPGHHLQSSLRTSSPLDELAIYPGNFEGWGCYVEYLGKDLGLYTDPYAYLGKWEWDLVRSARLVLDVGIHYYGWTHQQALDYWKATIPNQNDIAEREITRVTNWCAQALSYKVGADFIMKMKQDYLHKHHTTGKDFHKQYLAFGMVPLEVIRKHLLA